jgi:hypothetical protein
MLYLAQLNSCTGELYASLCTLAQEKLAAHFLSLCEGMVNDHWSFHSCQIYMQFILARMKWPFNAGQNKITILGLTLASKAKFRLR